MDKKSNKSEEFIKEMTSSLKGDEELRLDVSQELSSHYEESVANFKKGGRSDEESQELALQAFGDSKQIAEELVESNKNRMKSRALAGHFFKKFLVPASLILTIIMGFHYSHRFMFFNSVEGVIDGGALRMLEESLSDEERFLLYGDRSRSTRASQEKALWEKAPDNKVYFANYARLLLVDYGDRRINVPIDYIEKEFRIGESLDPDNSFYNYILAGLLFEAGSELKTNKKDKDNPISFLIKDEELLTRAVKELEIAMKKPEYSRYYTDLLSERMAVFPETKSMEHNIARIAFSAGTLIPELSYTKKLFSSLPHYVKAKDLSGEEAYSLLNSWQGFIQKATPDTWCLIDVLVIDAIISISGEQVSQILETLGKTEDAVQTRELAKQANQPVFQWKANKDSGEDFDILVNKKAGSFASILLPRINEPITDKELRPSRMVERVIGEQFILSLIIVFLGVILIISWLFQLKWNKLIKGDTSPILLIPTLPVLLKMVGLGVILPIIIYVAYTRWSGLSSYEFSLSFEMPRWMTELLLFSVTFLSVSINLIGSYFSKRCRSLGIPTVRVIHPVMSKIFWGILSIAWILCLTKNGLFGEKQATVIYLPLGLFVTLVFIVLVLFSMRKAWKAKQEYALFYSSVSKSLVPFYAIAIVVLGGVCLPYVQKKESDYLREDKIIFGESDDIYFSSLEFKLTQRLKKEMQSAILNSSED